MGVTTGVGKAVGVAVGGNHTTVGVTVGVVRIRVAVGVAITVGAVAQAEHKIPKKQIIRMLFIDLCKPCAVEWMKFWSLELKIRGNNPEAVVQLVCSF